MIGDALFAFLVAALVTGAVTPLAARLAVRVGAVDDGTSDRGLADRPTPLLGGLAIFLGALAAGLLFVPASDETRGILAAAALITAVGALDDWRPLTPEFDARKAELAERVTAIADRHPLYAHLGAPAGVA